MFAFSNNRKIFDSLLIHELHFDALPLLGDFDSLLHDDLIVIFFAVKCKGIVDASIHLPLMNGEVFLSIVVFSENFYLGVMVDQELMFDSDLILRDHPAEQTEAFLDDSFEGLLFSLCIGYIVHSLNEGDLECVHFQIPIIFYPINKLFIK